MKSILTKFRVWLTVPWCHPSTERLALVRRDVSSHRPRLSGDRQVSRGRAWKCVSPAS